MTRTAFLRPCALGLLALLALTPAADAASTGATPLLADGFASWLGSAVVDIVSDRARLIQVSVIFVVVGIGLLWMRR